MGRKILVVPEKFIPKYSFENGWLRCKEYSLSVDDLLIHSYFIERDLAETSPEYKQIIPYCVVTNKAGQILTYERNKKGNENRLHNKWSCGYGGHIDLNDTYGNISVYNFYYNSLMRELDEELGIVEMSKIYSQEGFIYDESDKVGAVHVGVVYRIKPLENEDFSLDKFKIEDTIGECRFETVENLKKEIDKFEGWSQILIRNGIL